MKTKFFPLLAAFLFLWNIGIATPSANADAHFLGTQEAFQEGPKKMSNRAVRQWYVDQVAVIPDSNEVWVSRNLDAETRARLAYDIRHEARLEAREMMRCKLQVRKLQKRDTEKYGNLDGPTFEYLVEKNQNKGLEGDAVYEAIVGSSQRTSEEYNESMGVEKKSE